MSKVLYTLENQAEMPDLKQLQSQYQLKTDDLDWEFGVQPIDASLGMYCIMVEQGAGTLPTEAGVEGPFSNPVIEPFGPPE